MPVYNGARHVGDSIASVVAQTLRPTEMFVVDDGSTDGSQERVEAIPTPFPRHLLHQDNRRQSAARNLAAAQASGKYLAFLDHDDIWYPHHLETLVAALEEDPRLGWAYCSIDEMDSEGRLVALDVLRGLNEGVEHPKTNVFNMLSADMFIFPSAAVVRAEAFHAVGGFDERLSGYEDDDLFLRLFRAGWLNHYHPAPLIRYRRHPASSAFSERMWISREIYAQKLIEGYPDEPELVRFYVRDIIAPRFFRAGQAEYIRHFPHRRWEQCAMSVELMGRYLKLMRLPFGRERMRKRIALWIMRYPRLVGLLYPLLRLVWPLPRLR